MASEPVRLPAESRTGVRAGSVRLLSRPPGPKPTGTLGQPRSQKPSYSAPGALALRHRDATGACCSERSVTD